MEKKQRLLLISSLLGVVVLAGCIELTITQKVHRSGASDINISAESDYEMVLAGFQNMVGNSSLAVENAKVYEQEEKVTYAFENVKPQASNIGSIGGQETGTSSLDVNVSKQFKFPNMVYNITVWNNASTGDQNTSAEQYGQFADSIKDSFEMNYEVVVFGSIKSTNGEKVNDQRVRFDLTKSKKYYVSFTDLFVRSWVGSMTGPKACSPEWDCSDWSTCTDFTQTRTCNIKNSCQNYMYKPSEQRSCQSPSIGDINITKSYLGLSMDVELAKNGFGTLTVRNSTGHQIGSTLISKEATNATIMLADDGAQLLTGGTYHLTLTNKDAVQAEKEVSFTGAKIGIQQINWTQGVGYTGGLQINTIGATLTNTGDVLGAIDLYYKVDDSEWTQFGYGGTVVPVGETTGIIAVPEVGVSPGKYNIEVQARANGKVLATKSKEIVIKKPDVEIRDINGTYTYTSYQYISDDVTLDTLGVDLANVGETGGAVTLHYKLGDSTWTALGYTSPFIPAGETTSIIYSPIAYHSPGTYELSVEARFNGESIDRMTESVSLDSEGSVISPTDTG